MKSVNVILNSKQRSTTVGDTQTANYFIDWKAILDVKKKYKLTWTYIGGSNIITGTKIPMVYVNFNINSYAATYTMTSTPTTTCLGCLKPVQLTSGTANSAYLVAETNTNECIYLDCIPLSNFFNVSIYDNTGALFTDNAGTPAKPAEYILTLKFTELEEPK